ncbi:MAG: U32 family peptidase [Lachnospiraceae bacterium]|nr:U32 family peptidase [Lachnospiraceae bacterium]
MNRVKKAELLAPAGSFDSLRAAVNAGADAVYMGGALFSARAYADNPDSAGMKESIDFCHFYGKKIYLALNTLLKDRELDEELERFVAPICLAGIDAVIVQDTGVMKRLGELFPDLPIHVSTQAAVTMAEGANLLHARYPQIDRVVAARELSLEELKRFRKGTELEIEVFIHGALCMSCSGLCLMSSNIGERSGNRGRCAQACRKQYDDSFLLSPKDQCLLDSIGELIEAGIDSLKIEGRMKSPEYTAGTVAVYRQAIDAFYGTKEAEAYIFPALRESGMTGRDILPELYNRGGFNKGYLHAHNGRDMMSLERPNHSGVAIGAVVKTSGREALIRVEREVYPGDVIEIRRGNEKIYEFTIGSGNEAGKTETGILRCLTMKERLAVKGDKVFRTRCEALLSAIRKEYIEKNLKVPVRMSFKAAAGEPLRLEMETADGRAGIIVNGTKALRADKAPLDEQAVKNKIYRLGDTDFDPVSWECKLEDNIFVRISELGQLRREGVEQLKAALINAGTARRSIPGAVTQLRQNRICGGESIPERKGPDDIFSRDEPAAKGITLIASVWNLKQLKGALEGGADEIYINLNGLDTGRLREMLQSVDNKKVKLSLGLPYVCRSGIYDRLLKLVREITALYPDIGFVVRNHEETALLESLRRTGEVKAGIHFDYIPYCMNRDAYMTEAQSCTVSPELTLAEVREMMETAPDKCMEMIIYGFVPSMITAQCIYKNKYGGCLKELHGRAAKEAPVLNSCGNSFQTRQLCDFCTNIIYNASCLNTTDRIEEVMQAGIGRLRFDFTFEDEKTVGDILKSVSKSAGSLNTVTEQGRRTQERDNGTGFRYTRGHFYKGVE